METKICIRDLSHLPLINGEIIPVVGELYTIRKVVEMPDGIVGFLLKEIVNNPGWYWCGPTLVYDEPNFDSRCFRDVDYSFGELVAEQFEVKHEMFEMVREIVDARC